MYYPHWFNTVQLLRYVFLLQLIIGFFTSVDLSQFSLFDFILGDMEGCGIISKHMTGTLQEILSGVISESKQIHSSAAITFPLLFL